VACSIAASYLLTLRADQLSAPAVVDIDYTGAAGFGTVRMIIPAGTLAGETRSEVDWKDAVTAEAWAFRGAFIAWTQANLGEVRVDYSPKSYVGIRRGRRVWAPLWFRKAGASIYLPDPDNLRGDQQSPAMDIFQERLREEGLETSWQPTYNAGANPVAIRLRQADLDKPVVQDLLRATFEILDQAVADMENAFRRYAEFLRGVFEDDR
jgi:hypothetical protein